MRSLSHRDTYTIIKVASSVVLLGAISIVAFLTPAVRAARLNPMKVLRGEQGSYFVNHYLAIEQMRFSDRLQIKNSVDPSALDGLVPCFLLQPLLENAIRHGISSCEDGGIIQTSVMKENEKLVIEVRDNGPGLAANSQSDHGIGLRNTNKRLNHFYAERSSLCIDSPPTGGFIVSITIPYERAAQ